jgi:hypothetical protein
MTDLAAILFWALIRFPGVPHTDTEEQYKLIEEGQVTNQWTLGWYLLLKLSTFTLSPLAFITILQLVAMVVVLRKLGTSITNEFPYAHRSITYFLFTPFFGYPATTVNHDLFPVCGLLLLFVVLYELKINRKSPSKIDLASSVLLCLFSYISIFAAALVLIYLVASQLRLFAVGMLVIFSSILVVNFTFPNISPSNLRWVSVVSDIKCATEDRSKVLSTQQKESLASLAPLEYWVERQDYSCASSNEIISSLSFTEMTGPQILRLWVSIGVDNPGPYIKAHLVKGGFALPPPFSPKPKEVFDLTSLDLEKRHNNEFLIMDRSAQPQRGVLADTLRNIMDLSAYTLNLFTGWIAWAGLWLTFVIAAFAKRLSNKLGGVTILQILVIFAPFLLTHLFILIAGPVSDARYLMATIVIGFLILFAVLLEKFHNTFNGDETMKRP